MQVITRLTLRALFAAALAAASATAPLVAHGMAEDAMAPTSKELNQLYWQGQESLKKSDWNLAIKRFAELEKQLRAKEPQSADAAIYWQAYALLQAKRTTEAKAAVERLHHDYPASRWGKDADALLRQTQPPAAVVHAATGAAAGSNDDDIAEIAVEGLINAPPERAVPLLKKVLQGRHSDKVKKRALFVLSQIDEDAALDSVVEVAKTSNDPALREEAIRMLGVSGEDRAIKRLGELYATSKDPAERRAIIQAWLVADRKDLILASARNEADGSVRQAAIQALGALDASSELKQLFDSTKDPTSQREIIQALGVAGDVKSLTAIAEGTQAEDVRVEAIHALGVAGDEGGSAALVKLYAKVNSPALHEAVMQGLLIAGDGDELLQLYRQARTKEEKQALLRIITATNSDAALDIIESELNSGGSPQTSSPERAGSGPAKYQRYAGHAIDEFAMADLWQWQVVDPQKVIVWSSINEAFLVTVASPCPRLEQARNVTVTQEMRQKVSRNFDFVTFGEQRCKITEIRPLDYQAMVKDGNAQAVAHRERSK